MPLLWTLLSVSIVLRWQYSRRSVSRHLLAKIGQAGNREPLVVPLRLEWLYEHVLVAYLLSLLFLYPYGFPVSAEAHVRLPDFFAVLSLALGFAAIFVKRSIRIDGLFMAAVGPFMLLEFILPVVGAMGYQQWTAAASGVRMAMLWLPATLLTWYSCAVGAERMERKLASVLKFTLWANGAYATIQIMVALGYAPRMLLFTGMLEPWAVDDHFRVVHGIRPAGFFVNTTALSVFGIASLCFFYARYVARCRRNDLAYSFLALFVVLLTTSRAASFSAALIIGGGWLILAPRRKLLVGVMIACGIAAFLLLVERTIGIEETFYRFQRLLESGLLADASFGARVYQIWPAALNAADEYALGTLVSAPREIELIDSGYLNYYAQGKWLFLGAVSILLLTQWVVGLRAVGRPGSAARLMLLNLAIYLSVAMVTSNPLRSPLVIFFIVFSFWLLKLERGSKTIARTEWSYRSR